MIKRISEMTDEEILVRMSKKIDQDFEAEKKLEEMVRRLCRDEMYAMMKANPELRRW